jgi:hypothetical protein
MCDCVPSGDLISGLYQAHAIDLARNALLLVGDRATAEDVVRELRARCRARLMPGSTRRRLGRLN